MNPIDHQSCYATIIMEYMLLHKSKHQHIIRGIAQFFTLPRKITLGYESKHKHKCFQFPSEVN